MSNITMTHMTDIVASGFGMPVYGCASLRAVKGAPKAAARVRQGGAVLTLTAPVVAGIIPGPRAWSPPI